MSDQVKRRNIIYKRIVKTTSKVQSIGAFKNESIGAIQAQVVVHESDFAKLS